MQQGGKPTSDWNPKAYLGFAAERAQPALDLIARLPNRAPRHISDLGCGPGNSTAMLMQAFPGADVAGFDSSPAMIAAARKAVPGALFMEADVANWMPLPGTDLVFSNALFQWLGDRDNAMRRILAALQGGATLAVQMPDNLGEPSHRLMRDVAEQGPWRQKLSGALTARQPLLDEVGYYDLLQPLTQQFHVWRTTYVHALDGPQAIIAMLATTGLKPFLEPLSEKEREAFLADYAARLAQHYRPSHDGKVLLRFPRRFILAVRA